MKLSKNVLGSVLAAATILSQFSLAQQNTSQQATPQASFTMAQLKAPLTQFYAPGTTTIPKSTRKALYDQSVAAYIRYFPKVRPTKLAELNNVSEYFVPSEKNNNNPDGFSLFSRAIDLLLKDNEAGDWSALKLVLDLGDKYMQVEEEHKTAK